jgi:hypothetical protein
MASSIGRLRYTAMNPDKHVENTLAAVRKWAAERKPKSDGAAPGGEERLPEAATPSRPAQ